MTYLYNLLPFPESSRLTGIWSNRDVDPPAADEIASGHDDTQCVAARGRTSSGRHDSRRQDSAIDGAPPRRRAGRPRRVCYSWRSAVGIGRRAARTAGKMPPTSPMARA